SSPVYQAWLSDRASCWRRRARRAPSATWRTCRAPAVRCRSCSSCRSSSRRRRRTTLPGIQVVAPARIEGGVLLFLADAGLVADEQVGGVRFGLGEPFGGELSVDG